MSRETPGIPFPAGSGYHTLTDKAQEQLPHQHSRPLGSVQPAPPIHPQQLHAGGGTSPAWERAYMPSLPTASSQPQQLNVPLPSPSSRCLSSLCISPATSSLVRQPGIPNLLRQNPQQQQQPTPVYIVLDANSSSRSGNNSYPVNNPSQSGGLTVVKVQQPPEAQQLISLAQLVAQQQQPQQQQQQPQQPQQPQQQQQQQRQRQRQQQQRPMHDVRQWGFAVVDQLHPSLPRVPLPPSVIAEETRGVALYNNNVLSSSTRPCTSQVCLLYGHTGCAAGRDCLAFHVSPDYLRLSRAVSQPLCCALHNCFYSHEMIHADCAAVVIHQAYCIALDTPGMLGPTDNPRLVDISLLHLSLTVGLETLPVRDGKAVISLRRQVCRLHLEGRCKWTKDCGHVHVCRTFLSLLEQPAVLDFCDAIVREDALAARIAGNVEVQQYIQSHAVLPIVTQLLCSNRIGALRAIVTGRVACVGPQLACLRTLGLVSSDAEVTLVQVSPKILPYLVP